MPVFFQCPDCGYKQRSKAKKRVKCHQCDRSYKKSDAKKSKQKTPDDEKGTGFFKYSRKD
jgi:tRNA(Ile2) C34 agmatinyltransferase TiaS